MLCPLHQTSARVGRWNHEQELIIITIDNYFDLSFVPLSAFPAMWLRDSRDPLRRLNIRAGILFRTCSKAGGLVIKHYHEQKAAETEIFGASVTFATSVGSVWLIQSRSFVLAVVDTIFQVLGRNKKISEKSLCQNLDFYKKIVVDIKLGSVWTITTLSRWILMPTN